MNDRRLGWILGLVLVLTVANLGATLYFGLIRSKQSLPSSTAEDASSQVSEKEANEIARALIDVYNTGNTHELYLKFDQLARIQFSEQKMTEEMSKLNSMVGKVQDFAYVNSVVAGKEGGRTFITLNYKARLSGGAFDKGTIRITVSRKDGTLGVFGFYVNGESHAGQ